MEKRLVKIGLFSSVLLFSLGGVFFFSKKYYQDESKISHNAIAIVKDIPGTGVPQIGGHFRLMDHTGKIRTHTDFRGQYLLIYFGYSFCPDICPTALSSITEALISLGELGEKIQPLFISIDPLRDTPQHLALYVQNFHPRLIALTGTPEQIKQVTKNYHVYYTKMTPDGTSTEYLMDHSSIIYLMSPQGQLIAHFNHQTPVEEIISKIKELL